LSEDSNVIENAEPENLIKQFVKELQMAYDHADIGMAGSFEIVSVPNW